MTRKWLLALAWAVAIIAILFYFWSRARLGLLSWDDGIPFIFFAGLGVIGSLIATRHPRNLVGQIFLAWFFYVNVDLAFSAAVSLYLADRSPAELLSLDTLLFVDAYNEEVISLTVWCTILVFPILYFPDGRLPSKRWRHFTRAVVALLLINMVAWFFHPRLPSTHFSGFQNPLAMPLAASIADIIFIPLIVMLIIPPLSLFFRFRNARGIERQQIKWPFLSALVGAIGIGWSVLAGAVFGAVEGDPVYNVGLALEFLSVLSFPITIGFAILRYRLYDIDVIISRTLLYSALSAALALVYFTTVALLQTIFPVESPIAVVLSTLAVATLFAPLRRRIQDLIDRRYYRRKYDAAQTLAAFSATVRDEVDLDRLSSALAQTVAATLQPTEVSLWLRQELMALSVPGPGSHRTDGGPTLPE